MTRRGAMLALLLWLPAAGFAQTAPVARVTYSRSFRASSPAYVQVMIGENGAGGAIVQENDGGPLEPVAFTASAATVRRIFQAAAALDEFNGKRLQSTAKVAYTGDKMLTYDGAGRHHAQTFTYTAVAAAAALETLMERIAATALDAVQLRRAMRYDRLDVLGMLEQMDIEWQNRHLGEPQILAPLLRQAAADPNLMAAARRRAGRLAAALAAAPAPKALE